MVGPLKTLQDLRKVEGAVRITCRACGQVGLLDREELIASRLIRHLSCDWSIVQRDEPCRDCRSGDVHVAGVPFSEDVATLRRRRTTMVTVTLALSILRRVAYPDSEAPCPPEAVRLALRALHPHVRDVDLLSGFWAMWQKPDKRPYETPAVLLAQIITILLNAGYAVPAEFRWASHL